MPSLLPHAAMHSVATQVCGAEKLPMFGQRNRKGRQAVELNKLAHGATAEEDGALEGAVFPSRLASGPHYTAATLQVYYTYHLSIFHGRPRMEHLGPSNTL